MKKIEADLKYYNANTRDASVGDCVKRALSVAYSEDYDKVSAELNQIKRDKRAPGYNFDITFNEFMKRRGDTWTKEPQDVTVDEFSQSHSSGVWLILCGKNSPSARGYSSHMAAIVNGNVYDSWNSLNYYVYKYCKVSKGKTDEYEFDTEEICKQVASAVDEYVKTNISAKLPEEYMYVHVNPSLSRESKYAYMLIVICKLKELPRYCKWRSGGTLTHGVIMKTNPRLSEEENIASLTKKTKQKVYDWIYNVKAEILDGAKLDKIGVNKHFMCNRAAEPILGKLPEWAIPRVTKIWDNGAGYDYGERFELEMEAFPEDPRYDDNHYVDFYADTLSRLKSDLEWYKEDYSRINYDY